MFVIDFDDTLFDTQAFKEARLSALQPLGISPELYWQTYKETRNDELGTMTYTNERHAAVLAAQGFSYEQALGALETTTGVGVIRFLFSDAPSFLTTLKTYGERMILLSLGDPEFNEMKVRYSGVEKFFDNVYVVRDTKEHILRSVLDGGVKGPVWFINDKVSESQAVRLLFPQLKIILKESSSIPQSEYVVSGLPHFKTLSEIQQYVQRQSV